MRELALLLLCGMGSDWAAGKAATTIKEERERMRTERERERVGGRKRRKVTVVIRKINRNRK